MLRIHEGGNGVEKVENPWVREKAGEIGASLLDASRNCEWNVSG